MNINDLPIEQLKPYDNNPRINDEAVPFVAESIQKFGWQQPIVITRDKVIVAGHTRYKAALRLGLDTVPCKYADELTPEEVDAYRLADNKTAERATWDDEKLKEELTRCNENIDMSAFGFEPPEEDPDDIKEDQYEQFEVEHVAERGMVFKLGDHRLMCGDSTSADDLEKLLGGVLPKFVFTDPPYGVSIGHKNRVLNTVKKANYKQVKVDLENDTLPPEQLYEVLKSAMANLKAHASDDCAYYVTSPQGGDLGLMMLNMMKDAGLPVRHILIWVKNCPCFSLGRLDYEYRHEPVFYTWGAKHNFYGGSQNTVIEDTKRLEHMTKAELKDLVHALRDGGETSVIYCDKPLHSDMHPSMKPIKLIARFMINSSQPGDPVADIFGGSGSTMIAAEQLNRRCYMMELDPHYCDVIIDRWQKFTGGEAELLND